MGLNPFFYFNLLFNVTGDLMNILVINAGSSSLKYKLFDMKQSLVMAGGVVERIGEAASLISHTVYQGDLPRKIKLAEPVKTHEAAMHRVVSLLIDPETGVIEDMSHIDAVGHRVVQGGEAFGQSILIDDRVKQAIEDNNPLAPLHNPANLTGIEVAGRIFGRVPHVAVFDTEFHQTMPEKAFLYALPYSFYETHRIRRYGFHGTSHKYVSTQAARLLGKPIEATNLISLHLGNGCSVCAVKDGACIDTSMGMTPLAGVMMGTRTGDMDPAIIGYLLEQTGLDITELDAVLNKKSGLKGICGSNDLRDIHEQAAGGSRRAVLALDMFSYQIKKYIGAYMAALGDVDTLVFTAGVGENDEIVRLKACENLSVFGIDIDLEKNKVIRSADPFHIHTPGSRIQVWVIPTNEELQIANDVVELLG